MQNIIKSIISVFATTFVYLLGGWDIAIQSLLIVIALDYITGIAKGYVSKTLNSNKGLKGIVKKLSMLCIVAVAVIIDNITGYSGMIRSLIIYYLVANEGLSIIENLGEMDIIVPTFLKDKLEQLKETNSKVDKATKKKTTNKEGKNNGI